MNPYTCGHQHSDGLSFGAPECGAPATRWFRYGPDVCFSCEEHGDERFPWKPIGSLDLCPEGEHTFEPYAFPPLRRCSKCSVLDLGECERCGRLLEAGEYWGRCADCEMGQ